MTEADTESIWDTTLDTTRFGKIGVRIAEQLNFWVNDDATKQVTNGAVTPILEQISEEILIELIAASQVRQIVNPVQYIRGNVVKVSQRILRDYGHLLIKIGRILGNEKMELVSCDLPSSTSDW